MPFITYPQSNGQVAVIIPADPSFSIEEIAAKDVPHGLPYKIVDTFDIENDYFNAYEFHAEQGSAINIDKAKSIHLDKFRAARAPKLSELDIAYSRADETGDTAKKAEIAAQKQALRDVTKVELPNDLAALKNFWPSILV
jgi:hypothetical protein